LGVFFHTHFRKQIGSYRQLVASFKDESNPFIQQ